MTNVLYIHGMGGGGDSRIPSILNDELKSRGYGDKIKVVVRTYPFDVSEALPMIEGWVSELNPSLVIGESLGSLHALRLHGLPHILVSPSLGAPAYFGILAWLSLLPGITQLFNRIYRPREGDRQKLHFTFRMLHQYPSHGREALKGTCPLDCTFAFFGTKDHYRKSGVVSVRMWKKHFGNTFSMYEGTHFMEEEHVRSVLMDKILKCLDINK